MNTSFSKHSILLIISLLCTISILAQKQSIDYEKAVAYRDLCKDKVYHGSFTTHWIGETGLFWYQVLTASGEKYFIVNPDKQNKKEAFSLEKLSQALSELTQDSIEAKKGSISQLSFSNDLKTLSFVCKGYHWECRIAGYKLSKGEAYKAKKYKPWSMARRDELGNTPVLSPDKAWKAYIEDYNLMVQSTSTGEVRRFTYDGGLGRYYSSYIQWSPDSKKLMSCKVVPAEKHYINYIESSPKGQLQPEYTSIEYYKPGDALPQFYPCIFNLADTTLVSSSELSIPNQYSLSHLAWRKDSKAFTFEYNQRGHQLYQVIELNAEDGEEKVLIEETSETFIHYSRKRFRYDIEDGKEIIWASERDGWNHLYRYDGTTGKVIKQITKGEWLVRDIIHVDQKNKTILFAAGGREEGDPYFLHYYRVNFDGSELTHLSPGDGNHKVSFSPDYTYMVDTWSKVDAAPVSVLREVATGKEIMPLEKADISALLNVGWKAPEVFVAKGRDGKTDIWGNIIYPSDYDSSKTYPVIEYIYAGPHSSFVPKDFTPWFGRSCQTLAELGFIVVSIDGMGTSNRSKAFHDVCYKNLKDAGFPDRIRWIQEAAKQHPAMDISKVGIYGMSAGGQSAAGALLFHPEFYKVAVSVCGCHDNRMDKIWWNEQWMGWPVGPHYAENSNVDNAWRLEGDLFLVVGEMDQNVDPASTLQVVDALLKAKKDFDFLVLPSMGHTWGGDYGKERLCNFLVENIMDVEIPRMNEKNN